MKIAKITSLGKAGKPAVKGKFAKKISENRKFSRVHKVAYSGGTKSAPSTAGLRDLQQPSFGFIFQMAQKEAKSYLIKHGVLASKKRRPEPLHCWGCQGRLIEQNDGSFRCPGSAKACQVRARVTQDDTAFTAFYMHKRMSQEPDYCSFLRTAFCLRIKLANDQCAHMVRQESEGLCATLGKVDRAYKWHKVPWPFMSTA